MRSILKWSFPFDNSELSIPFGPDATFRHADVQGGLATVWLEYQGKPFQVMRTLRIFGTGQTIPPGYAYLATVLDRPNGWVWHIYVDNNI